MIIDQVFVIAEAGVNHNGSLEMARELIDTAVSAGADAVKFQTFRASDLVARSAPKAGYQLRTTEEGESQFEMLQRLELSEWAHEALVAHARSRGIDFLSTPFDPRSLDFLIEKLGLKTIKVSSGDLTNLPFLNQIATRSTRVILSTGMGTLGEIEAALGALAHGFTDALSSPGPDAFLRAYAAPAGLAALRQRVALLHCTTEYPAPVEQVNLRAIETMRRAFELPVGYSDHTAGISVPIAAVALGARMIEKHFTLSRDLPGPDHRASLEPDELKEMIAGIRDVERALGDGIKRPTEIEWSNREVARKSVVAARVTRKGEPLEVECKRPGTGRSPAEFWRIQGRTAERGYDKDEPIDE